MTNFSGNKLFTILAISFVCGLALVTSGLASLPSNPIKSPVRENEIAAQEEETQPLKVIEADSLSQPEEDENIRLIKIEKGDTLAGLLSKENISHNEIAYAVEALKKVFELRKLRAGQEITLEVDVAENETHIKSITFQPNIQEIIKLDAEANNKPDAPQYSFSAKLEEIPLEKVSVKASGKIESSFYESMVNSGVTDNVTLQLIAALSFVVDFQRDIHSGDEFTVLYEAFKNEDGEFLKGRRPLYAKMNFNGKDIEIFAVEKEDGTLGYYHGDGKSVKKGLLRTPVNGARISSTFGKRKHPVLGYSKMHKGVDFAAPRGTPIYAAGDGVVSYAGRKGGYGNYVQIRHNKTYSTAYAHINKFAKNIKNGKRVKQGEVIAYVGTTGMSTGPHLHYEVLKNNTQINPQNANLPIKEELEGKALAAFKKEREKIIASLNVAPKKSDLAILTDEKAPANAAQIEPAAGN